MRSTAAATPAATDHGDTPFPAGFWALTLGSIGVVYGDIGTSPLYAFREAVDAAGRDRRRSRERCWACSR